MSLSLIMLMTADDPVSNHFRRSASSPAALPRLFEVDALLFSIQARPTDIVRQIVSSDELDEVLALPVTPFTIIGSALLRLRHRFPLPLC